jgi:uncharacterized membrane protein
MSLLAHALNGLLLLVMCAVAAGTYDRLPETIPMHFGADGMPDSVTEKTYLNWMILPLVALGMTALIYLSALFVPLVRRRPHLVNLPGRARERFLRLTPAQREPVLQLICALTFWIAVPTNGLMVWIQWLVYRAALAGRMLDSPWPPMIAFLLVLCVVSVAFIVWMYREIGEAEGDRSS